MTRLQRHTHMHAFMQARGLETHARAFHIVRQLTRLISISSGRQRLTQSIAVAVDINRRVHGRP